ncbi:hypothetical protein LCGC14_2241170 [marine sediment metagenome]|uniref:Uncharacterized protein n=1 Tax=marine sediment metagenome TaxID=412755 RepID=A0A0F9D5L6_9ZZZZ
MTTQTITKAEVQVIESYLPYVGVQFHQDGECVTQGEGWQRTIVGVLPDTVEFVVLCSPADAEGRFTTEAIAIDLVLEWLESSDFHMTTLYV